MKGYWITRQGKKLKIKDMETVHILNCMAMLSGKRQLCLIEVLEIPVKDLKRMMNKYYEFMNEWYRREHNG